MIAVDIRFQSDFIDNLMRFEVHDRVRAMECSSLDAAENFYRPISFLFIDGHHGKAHAYADLMVWDTLVMPGGIVAFDDTAGFMLGPNMQLQAAIRAGAYELISDVGGISFLRKKTALLPEIGDYPCAKGSLVAYLDYIGAWLGAMDPSFRFPQIPVQNRNFGNTLGRKIMDTSPRQAINYILRKFGSSGIITGPDMADENSPASRTVPVTLKKPILILEWLQSQKGSDMSFENTLLYLSACMDLRLGNERDAIEKLEALAEIEASIDFFHYHISIRDFSVLRLAQVHDLGGKRDEAKAAYDLLVKESGIPEIRQQAESGLSEPFRDPVIKEKFLLRELNADLNRYRVMHDSF